MSEPTNQLETQAGVRGSIGAIPAPVPCTRRSCPATSSRAPPALGRGSLPSTVKLPVGFDHESLAGLYAQKSSTPPPRTYISPPDDPKHMLLRSYGWVFDPQHMVGPVANCAQVEVAVENAQRSLSHATWACAVETLMRKVDPLIRRLTRPGRRARCAIRKLIPFQKVRICSQEVQEGKSRRRRRSRSRELHTSSDEYPPKRYSLDPAPVQPG